MSRTFAFWCIITGPEIDGGIGGPVQWSDAASDVELLADGDVEWLRVLRGFDAATSALLATGALRIARWEGGFPLLEPDPDMAAPYRVTIDITAVVEETGR